MKEFMIIAMLRLPACICFIGAIYILSIGVTSGWGWLLFIGVLCCGSSISYKDDGAKVKE